MRIASRCEPALPGRASPFERTIRVCSRALACAALLLGTAHSALCAEHPSIVYILADDLGWKDVGYHGGTIRTPHLDRMAQSGVRLERFYSEPYSTSARAALLTGRYPMRYGLQTLSILPWSQYGLPTGERLLPEALQQAGYRTAMVGTWQLGHYNKDYWPTRRGFDSFYGSFNGEHDCLRKSSAPDVDWYRNERPVKEHGYCTALLGKEAARIIDRHDTAQPLFLYVSFNAPRAPMRAPKEYLDAYRDIGDEQRRTYAALVSALDDAIGGVVAALDKRKMTANTLIIVQSDNGGALPHQYSSGDGDVQKAVAENGPYRDGKGSFYEGGLRVIALASWPGTLPAGVVAAERIHVTDMYPTLLGLAGASLEQTKPLDGIDQWQTIANAKLTPRKEMLLGMEDFRGALMIENWKLIVYSRLPVRYELYNVHDDPSEEDNYAERYPDRVQQMLLRFNEYAWEMAPSLYLEDLRKPKKFTTPIYWGDNPVRPGGP